MNRLHKAEDKINHLHKVLFSGKGCLLTISISLMCKEIIYLICIILVQSIHLDGEWHNRLEILSSLNFGRQELLYLRKPLSPLYSGRVITFLHLFSLLHKSYIHVPGDLNILNLCLSVIEVDRTGDGLNTLHRGQACLTHLCFCAFTRARGHQNIKIEIGCITLNLNMFLRIFDYFFSVHQLGISFKDPFHRKQPSGSIPRSVVVAVDRKITSCNPPQKVPVEGMAWEISGKKKVVKMENTRAIIPRVIGLIL